MSDDSGISGDRGIAQMRLPRGLAQKLPHYLATGLIVAVGLGLLVAYYVQVSRHAKETAKPDMKAARHLSQSEMRLPSLGTVATPADTRSLVTGLEHSGLQLSSDDAGAMSIGNNRVSAPAVMRDIPRVSPVVIHGSLRSMDPIASDAVPASAARTSGPSIGEGAQEVRPIPVVAATVLPTRRWLLPKGSFLNCTLETAIDSTLAGFSTCVIGTDVYGADGRVVLLERGSRLIGEVKSEVRAGQARVMVIWNEARTPTGVVVNLQSPGTDALGRSGVPGEVDRHTAERFGAAMMLSMFDAGVTAVTTHAQGSGGIVYNAQASRDVASEALKYSIGIAPTIRVSAGARLSVTVVRDLDFRSVYGLVDHAE